MSFCLVLKSSMYNRRTETACSRAWLLPPVPYRLLVLTAECGVSKDWRDCWVTAGDSSSGHTVCLAQKDSESLPGVSQQNPNVPASGAQSTEIQPHCLNQCPDNHYKARCMFYSSFLLTKIPKILTKMVPTILLIN